MTKILIDEAVVRQALEALEYYQHRNIEWEYSDEHAITALRKALSDSVEQPRSEAALAPAQQEPAAWGNLANWCLDSDRVLITDKAEAAKYHRDVYDLTPLYITPPAPAQPPTDNRMKVKLGSQYGADLEGHWFYLRPADEFAEAALVQRTGITKGGAA